MTELKRFNEVEAKRIGETLHIDWSKVSLQEFAMGVNVELEHGITVVSLRC